MPKQVGQVAKFFKFVINPKSFSRHRLAGVPAAVGLHHPDDRLLPLRRRRLEGLPEEADRGQAQTVKGSSYKTRCDLFIYWILNTSRFHFWFSVFLLWNEQVFSVELQLLQALFDVVQCPVSQLLLGRLVDEVRVPPLAQLLDRAHVHNSERKMLVLLHFPNNGYRFQCQKNVLRTKIYHRI